MIIIYMTEAAKENNDTASYEKLQEYMVKKSRDYENKNKALGPTLDPIVSPLIMAHSAMILVFETCVYTITPVIEKNYYVNSGIGMCLDTYMRLYIMFAFVFSFIDNCLTPTKKQMLLSSLDTNTQKLKTVGIYLADVLYKTKQEEIDTYIKEDIQAAVKEEITAKINRDENVELDLEPFVHTPDTDEEDEDLNREYNG